MSDLLDLTGWNVCATLVSVIVIVIGYLLFVIVPGSERTSARDYSILYSKVCQSHYI